MTTPPPRLLGRQDMGSPETLDAGVGVALLFSARRPARDADNEDALAALPVSPSRLVLAVADGVGGHPAGGLASSRCLEALAEALAAHDPGLPSLRPAVLNGIEQANERVAALGVGAATTLAVLTVDGRRIRPYHVGDSTILVVGQRGRVRLQTVDHSPTGYGLEAGLLREREALEHAERHVVSNFVGSEAMRIEIGPSLELKERDTVLLATDGLFDNLRLDEIVGRIRKGPLEEAGRQLAEICHRRMVLAPRGQPSKPDDLTFILYRPRRGGSQDAGEGA